MTAAQPFPSPPRWSKALYIRIPRPEIVFFKFMLEGEHNTALMTVVDKYEAVIKICFAPGQEEEVHRFLDRMSREIPLDHIQVQTAFQKLEGG